MAAAALARVDHKGRPHLALLGEDHTIRLFPIDAGGKVGDLALTFHDAYARAESELLQHEPARRKHALAALAGYDDGPRHRGCWRRRRRRTRTTRSRSRRPRCWAPPATRARKPLEDLLAAPEEQVRLAALAGLRAIEGREVAAPASSSRWASGSATSARPR